MSPEAAPQSWRDWYVEGEAAWLGDLQRVLRRLRLHEPTTVATWDRAEGWAHFRAVLPYGPQGRVVERRFEGPRGRGELLAWLRQRWRAVLASDAPHAIVTAYSTACVHRVAFPAEMAP